MSRVVIQCIDDSFEEDFITKNKEYKVKGYLDKYYLITDDIGEENYYEKSRFKVVFNRQNGNTSISTAKKKKKIIRLTI